ncbi:pentapeptide repeat-containing protein [Cohnella candidum]|uniref:Pentapeptide repeat-containing protein n=1 Tax=Cohnella candidum TaxID=2674991 RepID=A0A3G3JV25_9BACL|nr:pentapeptide repeat-containing protein [Cohnella candidum]AYQ72098.1 pentapeptide repeat-containing protein [Cohnella candidum]
MELKKEKLALQMADISGSTFDKVNAQALIFDNVNLAGSKVNNANMSGVSFSDVNLSELKMSDANLSGARIEHANMSHLVVDHVHLFGTEFTNVVLPQEGDGNYLPDGQYKPIVFRNCNLSNMEIIDCDITGLKINGILIEELLKGK